MGITDVGEGRLLNNGSLASTASVVVRGGATLGGSGSIGTQATVSVQSGGTLAPGNSTGILTLGSLDLNGGSTLAVELNGTTAGAEYDQVNASGAVNVGDAQLAAALRYAPTVGDKLFILVNDGDDAVTGTFSGLPQGSVFRVIAAGAASFFMISYRGDSASGSTEGGNDVVLLAVPQAAGTMLSVR
jgi:hypothetical protein